MPSLTLLATEGFADWEAAPLAAAARSWYGADLIWATPDGSPVRSAGGLHLMPDANLSDAVGRDALVVIGGSVWRKPEAPDIAGHLHAEIEAGHVVAAICDATRPLAATGHLDRVAHTSNDADTLDVPGYSGAARFRASSVAVRDGRIVTAPGTAPVSFMAEILAAIGLADESLTYWTGMLGAEHAPRARAA